MVRIESFKLGYGSKYICVKSDAASRHQTRRHLLIWRDL
jgi:hypothetical protein